MGRPGIECAGTLARRPLLNYLSTKMNTSPRQRRTTKGAAPERPRKLRASPTEQSALKLWVVLSRAYGAVAQLAQADITRHGLTSTEFAILEALYHVGPLLLGELQQKILVSSGGVTYLVDRLEEKGLVERRDCPDDRRARYAALTREGEQLIARIFPEHAQRIARAMSGLTADERAQATTLMRKLGTAAAELSLPKEP